MTEEQKKYIQQKYQLSVNPTTTPEGEYNAAADVGRLRALRRDKTDVNEYKQTPEGKSLLQQLKDRWSNVMGIADKATSGDINIAEQAYQTGGQAIGGMWDIVGKALEKGWQGVKAITPDAIEAPIKQGFEAVMATPLAQEGLQILANGMGRASEEWNIFKEENPRLAANLEASLEYMSILPLERGAKIGGNVVKGGLEDAATVAGKTATKLEGAVETQRKNFIEKLLEPIQSKKSLEEAVPRTTEKGKGLLQRSEVAPTPQETRMIDVLKDVEGVSHKKSVQQNYNAIVEAAVKEAESLKTQLANNNFLVSKKEIMAKLRGAAERLTESPTIVGSAEKTAQKLIAGAEKIFNEAKGTATGVLDARKKFDDWVQSQKPNAFDAKSDNAFTIANREIRNTINDLLEEKATNVAVKDSLKKQSTLYSAAERLVPKAAQEANTRLGRIWQNVMKTVGIKNKAVQALATAAGIGGLGAAATFAPAALGALITSGVVYKAGKFVLSPEVKNALIKVLREVEKIGGKEANVLKGEIDDILKVYDDVPPPKVKGAATPKTAIDLGAEYDKIKPLAEKAQQKIGEIANKYAEKYNGIVADTGIKAKSQWVGKVERKLGGDPSKITDTARNTIVVDNPKDVYELLKSEKGLIKHDWKSHAENPLGYEGGNVRLKVGDIVAEIQTASPDMIFAKEKAEVAKKLLGNSKYQEMLSKYGDIGGQGHILYEKYRQMDKFSPDRFKIADESRRYYNKFTL